MNDIERQKRHFEAVSEKYLLSRKNVNHLAFKELLWNFFHARNGLPKKRLAVLEPMCGYAEGRQILKDYLSLDIDYAGFDYSEKLIRHIRENRPKMNVEVMDVTKFASERIYDVIILIGGLHHVYRHADIVISSLSNALNSGGFFISFEPTNNNCLIEKIRKVIYKNNSLFDAETESAFRLKELNEMFLKNNFKLIDQVYPGLLCYILYYNPDAFPYLNVGNPSIVGFLFNAEKRLYAHTIGRKLSFATLSLWKKN